jgi:hypothetical protein
MRPWLMASAAILLSTAVMAQPAVTAKIEVNVVNVDVTVSSHGQPVRNLTRDDFRVFEDDVEQPLTNFYPVEGSTRMKVKTLSDSEGSGLPVPDPRFRRKVLVVIDNLHTTTVNRNRALEKLEGFINDRFTGGDYDWSIAVAGQRLLVVLPLTSDKKAIHDTLAMIRSKAAWKSFRAGSGSSEGVANASVQSPGLIPDKAIATTGGRNNDSIASYTGSADALEGSMFAADTTLAIRDATRAFANIDGKKIVLLLSGGFGGNESVPCGGDCGYGGIETLSGNSPGDLLNQASTRAQGVSNLREMLIREANASNVNLYIINPEGLNTGARDTVAPEFAPSSGDTGSMYWLAAETGGRLMPGNRPEQALSQFDVSSSNYYSLGYRPSHGQDSRYHRIKVQLRNRRGYQLQYRDGYTSLPMDVQIVRQLLTPFSPNLQQNAITLTVTAGELSKTGGITTLPLQARVPVKELQFIPGASGYDAQIDVYVSIFDSKGRNVSLQRFTTKAHAADVASQQQGELIHNATIKVPSGKPYTVVVAVRDGLTDAFSMNAQTYQF